MLPTGKPIDLRINGRPYLVTIDKLGARQAEVTVNGKKYTVAVAGPAEQAPSVRSRVEAVVSPPPVSGRTRAAGGPPAGSKTITALMPGVIVSVKVAVGQAVERGDILVILEAMKMENEIRADRKGTIAQVHVPANQKVQTGDPLVTFE